MPERIEIAHWIVAILVFAVLLIASWRDIAERRIPNWTVVAVALLFVGWALTMPNVSVISALEAAAIVFVGSAILFASGVLGAGDSKLMTALALYCGVKFLLLFALATVLFGGALAVFSLLLQPRRAIAMLQMGLKAGAGRGIPYGVAISLAGLLILLHTLSCVVPDDVRMICF